MITLCSYENNKYSKNFIDKLIKGLSVYHSSLHYSVIRARVEKSEISKDLEISSPGFLFGENAPQIMGKNMKQNLLEAEEHTRDIFEKVH